jgi:hypothetical protein
MNMYVDHLTTIQFPFVSLNTLFAIIIYIHFVCSRLPYCITLHVRVMELTVLFFEKKELSVLVRRLEFNIFWPLDTKFVRVSK